MDLSDVLGLPEKARREHISSKLTYGDLDPGTATNIINTARDLANEIIRTSVPKSMMPKVVDFGDILPPPYTSSLIGLIERALARPNIYLSMPQHLDFLLFEQGIKGRDYSDDELMGLFGYTLSNEKFKVSRNILSFVRESCGLDWKSMWGKSNTVRPIPRELKSEPNSQPREVESIVKPVESPSTIKEPVDAEAGKGKADGSSKQLTFEEELKHSGDK